MCFEIHKDNREYITFNRDITSYKVVIPKKENTTRQIIPNQYRSNVKSFEYEKGYTYNTKIGEPEKQNSKDDALHVAKGFHSYSTFDEAIRAQSDFVNPNNVRIVSCTIPKGSTYLHNPDQELYVSNQIMINEDVTPSSEFRLRFLKSDPKRNDRFTRPMLGMPSTLDLDGNWESSSMGKKKNTLLR